MTEVVEDVGTNALEPTPALVLEAPEAVIEETPVVADAEPEPGDSEPKQHHLKGKTPWYMERINEETNKRRETEARLAQAERERQEAKTLLERLQSGDKTEARSNAEEPDIDALVDARAEQKLFNADCNTVAEKGSLEIDGFDEKLGVLRAIGVVNDEFLKDVFAVDKSGAHKILDALSQDPDRAQAMTRMTSRARIAALTRMTMTEVVKPVPVVPKIQASKVPPPKPVIDAIGDDSGETDLTNDKLDDSTWSKLWDKKYRKRA